MTKHLQNIQTDPGLLAKLRNQANGETSAKEIFEQRVSFVFGSMAQDSGVTREQVRKVILEQAGR